MTKYGDPISKGQNAPDDEGHHKMLVNIISCCTRRRGIFYLLAGVLADILKRIFPEDVGCSPCASTRANK